MRTPIAWHNVVHNKLRAAAAIGGVAFAILLMFMQLGIFSAAEISALLVYGKLDFDVILTSPQYKFLVQSGQFARARLQQARGVPEVASVVPFSAGYAHYRNREDRLFRGMLILGVDPDAGPFLIPELQEQLPKLHQDDSMLVDRRARGDFGPREVGDIADFGAPTTMIVGKYSMGTGFIAGADAVVSERTYRRLFGIPNSDRVSFGLVKLVPGADVEEVCRRLEATTGPDVRALTRKEIQEIERHYFVNVKPIGIMFRSGVLIGFLVGAVTLYQILATEVTNRSPELATLKAIGYTDRFVYQVVLQEGILFAGLGYIPAFILSLGVYFLIRAGANVPVWMTAERAVVVLLLTCVMCGVASAFALRKVRRADPADLF